MEAETSTFTPFVQTSFRLFLSIYCNVNSVALSLRVVCLIICLFVLLRVVSAIVFHGDWREMLNVLLYHSLPYFLVTWSCSVPKARLVSCAATPDFDVGPSELFSGPFACLTKILTHWAISSPSNASSNY